EEEKPDFKVILADFADWSTLSGLKHIISSRTHLIRLAWTAIFIMLCALFGYFLYLSISNYLSYPSEYATQIIFEEPIFPRVSFCNLNAFKYADMATEPSFAALFAMQESYRLVKQGYATSADLYGFNTMDRFEMYKNARLAHLVLSSQIPESSRASLAYDYTDLVTECTFMGTTCTSADFTSFFHSEFGRCFTFSSNRSVTRVGAMTQLRLLLTANAYNSRGLKWANLPSTERLGFKVVVHTPEQFPDVDRYGLYVAPGHQTAIGVNKFRMERLDKPYGRCTTNQSSDANFYSQYEYTIGACLDSCRQKYTVEKCGCAHPAWRKADNDSYCGTTIDQYHCLMSLRGDQTKDNKTDQNLNAIRDCECYDPCIETRITATVSFSSYPAMLYSVGTGTNSQFDKLYSEQGGGRDTTTTTTTLAPGEDPDNQVGCLSNLDAGVRDDVLYARDTFNLLKICNDDPPCKVKITPAERSSQWHSNWPCYYKFCNRPNTTSRKGSYECKDVLPYINFIPNSGNVPGWSGWETGAEPTLLTDCLSTDRAPSVDNSCPSGTYMPVWLVRWKLWVWKVGLSSAMARKKRSAGDDGLSAWINSTTTSAPSNQTVVDNPGLGSCDTWNMNFDSVDECNKWYQSNGLILQVYVDSLQYTKMTQGATFPILSVLIEIGGNAGLWLGMSFISCIELIGLIWLVFYQCFTGGCRRKGKTMDGRENVPKRRDSLSE
ncbi:hypothetical protein PENTCL1PPCAC_23309, partial [Pristionchus entomophagus]